MILDELRAINLNQMGALSPIAKGVIAATTFLSIIGLGWYFGWSAQLELIEKKQEEETGLRDQYVIKKTQAINIDIYKQQRADIEKQFGTLLRQLPSKSEMDGLLSDINHAGVSRDLQFELFKPAASEIVGEFYAELPVALRVIGNYSDMGSFANDLARLPRIVTLTNLALVRNKEGLIQMDAIARTFRYLDETELAAQRKTLAEKKK